MTPPTPGVGSEGASNTEPHPVVTQALAPLFGGTIAHDPRVLKAQLAEAFELGLAEMRRQRGDVHQPEDTHATVRKVYDIKEHAAAFAGAFTALAKRATDALGDELLDAVGEQDGIPNQAMNVSHSGAVIRIAPEYTTSRSVDMDQVLYVLAESEALAWTEQGNPLFANCAEDHTGIVQFAVAVAQRALAEVVQSTKPKTSGIEALAATLGHHEEDTLASVARSAVGKPQKKFTKIGVEYRPAA